MTVATLPNGGRKTPLVMQVDFSDPDLLVKLPSAVVTFVKTSDLQRQGNAPARGKYEREGISLQNDLMKYIRKAGVDRVRLSTLVEIIDRYVQIEPKDEEVMLAALRGKPLPQTNPLAVDLDEWDQGPLYTKQKTPPTQKASPYHYDWSVHEWEEPMTTLCLYPHHIKGKTMPEAYKAVTEALWRLNRNAAAQFFEEVREWVFECETPTWHEFMLLISQYAYLVPSEARTSSAVVPREPPF